MCGYCDIDLNVLENVSVYERVYDTLLHQFTTICDEILVQLQPVTEMKQWRTLVYVQTKQKHGSIFFFFLLYIYILTLTGVHKLAVNTIFSNQGEIYIPGSSA